MGNEITSRRRAPVETDDCGMATTAKLLGDKWTLLILREIFYGVIRFADIQADLNIPKAVLSKRLSHLVDIKVLTRQPYREPNSRVRHAYTLTSSGAELALPLLAMMNWGDTHQRQQSPAFNLVEKKSQKTLKLALVAQDTPEVPLNEVSLVFNTND